MLIDKIKDSIEILKPNNEHETLEITKISNTELLVIYKYLGKIHVDKEEIRIKLEDQDTVAIEAVNRKVVVKRNKNDSLQSFLYDVILKIGDLIMEISEKVREKEKEIVREIVANKLEELELITDLIDVHMKEIYPDEDPVARAVAFLKPDPSSTDPSIEILGKIEIHKEFDIYEDLHGYSEGEFYIYGIDIICKDEELQEVVFSEELMRKIAEFIAELKKSDS